MRVPRMHGLPKQTFGSTDILLKSGFIVPMLSNSGYQSLRRLGAHLFLAAQRDGGASGRYALDDVVAAGDGPRLASSLTESDGTVTNNMPLVPTNNGLITAFVTDPLILSSTSSDTSRHEHYAPKKCILK
jgi:hypothetical protein